MPFDYQMITFEEFLKNYFFKWTQLMMKMNVLLDNY